MNAHRWLDSFSTWCIPISKVENTTVTLLGKSYWDICLLFEIRKWQLNHLFPVSWCFFVTKFHALDIMSKATNKLFRHISETEPFSIIANGVVLLVLYHLSCGYDDTGKVSPRKKYSLRKDKVIFLIWTVIDFPRVNIIGFYMILNNTLPPYQEKHRLIITTWIKYQTQKGSLPLTLCNTVWWIYIAIKKH